MTRLAILLGLLLGGCAAAVPPAPAPARPMRIVSLDYCADQYVLKLVPRDRILALSSDATRDFSYLRAAARGIARVPPRAEDALVLKPDLVIRSYGGGADIGALLARAGVPMVQLGYPEDLPAIRAQLVDIAGQLGSPGQGRAVAAEFDARLARLAATPGRGTALYVTPGGVTGGPNTLVDVMLRAAGYSNFVKTPGWHSLPLEKLAYRRPDRIVAARFGTSADNPDRWSAARHPVAQAGLADRDTVRIDGALTACGGWFLLDAIEQVAR